MAVGDEGGAMWLGAAGDDGARAGAIARPFRPSAAGLAFRCAETIDDVLAAWHLVYTSQRRRHAIPANRHQLHAAQSAVTPRSVVLLGQIGPVTVSTLTATIDMPAAAGRIEPDRFASLRRMNRRVLELHLFADRREDEERATDSLLQLMALGWAWGHEHRATDCVMAVEPARARFFAHAFGFEPVRAARPRAATGIVPVTMWCDITLRLAQASPPIGWRFLIAQPTATDAFTKRYPFESEEVACSPIGEYLSEKYLARAG